MHKLKGKTVAIIGGGPGGLTLARLLQMKAVSVTVYERDHSPNARSQGATLNINEGSGLLAIEKAGLMEGFRKVYRPDAEKMAFTDLDGNIVIDDFGAGGEAAEGEGPGPGEDRPEIDRGPLRHLLLDSLSPGTVHWDAQFQSLERNDAGVTIHFKNRASVQADFVVAADGGNSKLRPYLTDIKPIYSGMTIVEGIIDDIEKKSPDIFKKLNGGKICALSEGHSFFVMLKGDGSAAFYSCHYCPEDWAKTSAIDWNKASEVAEWFKKEFKGWGKVWEDLILQCEAKFIPRPQYHLPLDQSWESSEYLTMIGDAAHVMPPYAGEGVNLAMCDAMDLSDCLMNDEIEDLRSAVEIFEKKMLLRAAETTVETLKNAAGFHCEDPIAFVKSYFGPPAD